MVAHILVAVLFFSSCQHESNMQQYRAEDFFQDDYLKIAKAIESEDTLRLKKLAEGQDLSLKGKKDMDLLWFAIFNEKFDAITALIELGVNADAQIAQGLGSALEATFMKHDDTRFLKAMLDGGLSPNHIYPRRKLMLQRGVFGGLDHVKLLLSHGARINDQDSMGGTALYESTTSVKPAITAYLIEQGADIHLATVNGVTPIWSIYQAIEEMNPSNPLREQFVQVRDQLIDKGIAWPPLSPVEVREQMRERGEKVVIPKGQSR